MTKKIKVEPLTCTKGASVQSIGKSITDIMSFMFSVVEDTNKTILSINKAIDAIPEDYNHKLDEAAKSIVSGIKIPTKFGDTSLANALKDITQSIQSLSSDMESIKKSVSLNQAEIRSYRNITGGQLDEMRRKLDKLTEMK